MMASITTTDGTGPQPTPATRSRRAVEVVLASDLSLVAEAVAAALASRDIRTSLLSWPRVPRDDPAYRQLSRIRPDVAILLYDVDLSIRMAEAGALIRGWDGPWLVLTGASPGVAWGGLRSAGAAAVRTSMTDLDELEALIRHLSAGEEAPCAELLDDYAVAWREAQEENAEVQSRVDSLTPRERQVLDLLRHGIRVRGIASMLGLSESTVRSQVRSVLRKLDVRSQLAAVAMLRAMDEAG
ncbi:helix-turn-helix transcriptional regulator [Nocardioides sp. URHA0020]|uniref:helix-turn-helix transcriptional regulator n=1 Tax=Nocardioides sp. URHA0020 TaxID=1380392 RepID=UPI0004915CA0|nr:response regulator transcription factor [Nocardioides sp. URHA0020]